MGPRNFQPDEFFHLLEREDGRPSFIKEYVPPVRLVEGEEYGYDGKFYYVRPEFDIGDGMFVVYDSQDKPVSFILHRGEFWISSNAWANSVSKTTAVYDSIKGLV